MEINLNILNELEEMERRRYASIENLPEDFDLALQQQQFRTEIIKLWETKDIIKIITMLDILPGSNGMCFVSDNQEALMAFGLYEKALLHAYCGLERNLYHWPFSEVKYLFSIADPERMRAAGDKIPKIDSFTVYRGVAGNTVARRVNSVSWTDSINVASFFAMRFKLNDPAVFKVVVPNEWVMARIAARNESEYILRLPLPVKPKSILKIQMFKGYKAYLKNHS